MSLLNYNHIACRSAHFSPTYPLSLYLHGAAGSGKSSLVRGLFPSLNAAIARHCDPELLVRFVKQNLNKPYRTLRLEFELRPNNNDYSVMSIIQGRRMTLSQSKPGLVLVALEEMPSDEAGADPRQSDVGQLLSMRFSGRRGDFRAGEAPRNSEKRGITGDATIVSIFTSNYKLEGPCVGALKRLEMFRNIKCVKVAPICGKDRQAFAFSYLAQRVREFGNERVNANIINLGIPCGEGDLRPLVRYLRMLSFYIRSLVLRSKSKCNDGAVRDVSVSFDEPSEITTITVNNGDGEQMQQLKPGSFENLYVITTTSRDTKGSTIAMRLLELHPNLQHAAELSQILDFYFTRTLAPAVILSQNQSLIKDLIRLLSSLDGVHGIEDVDPLSYKIMRSLYDPSETPNLRNDILEIIQTDGAASVAVELLCRSKDAQLQIREIIEDTPSMTAFSTKKSALRKDGLMFGVFVEGEITPEIRSRASLII